MGKNKDFCGVVMLSEGTKILEFSQYQNYDKTASITYAVLEPIIKIWIDVKIVLINHLQQK